MILLNFPSINCIPKLAGSGIEVSWAGGIDGREVIDVFIPYIEVSSVGCICIIWYCRVRH